MSTYRVILASGSPRRRELLEAAGYSFTVEVSDANEDVQEKNPARLVELLAEAKAGAVAENYISRAKAGYGNAAARTTCPPSPMAGTVIIGADTIVVHKGRILGKPADQDHAAAMIRELSGDIHQVYTGVSIFMTEGDRILEKVCFYEKTDVHVKDMTEEEIQSYVLAKEPVSPGQPDKGERFLWQDKAGGYGIQTGWGSRMISGISGDYYNVVGLPVCRLCTELDRLAARQAPAKLG